jgi:voltage-gated potassium channel
MDTIVFLILRRMRTPLLLLIVTYAVTIAGLALIPGVDAAGNAAAPMSIFHAFYFVSYTATTIGFGEIPSAFSDAQRLWVSFTIYASVVAWIYSIGTLIALLQDRAFQRAIIERRFAKQVGRIASPFHLVCGYGETGQALVQALTHRHRRVVVIDYEEARINLLKLGGHREYVPALLADARRPSNLAAAGLRNRWCAGVVALTDVNKTNLKIAIAAKLIRPGLKVICRADSRDVEANMASFGTDHIYDPFDTFAVYLGTALQAPCLVLLYTWLSAVSGEPLRDPIYPPASGLWILCGYGRFGKAIYQHLKTQGVELVVIEADPGLTGMPPEGVVTGRGTEAETLDQAHIHRAVGLVAGTDDDASNLSILMTAKQMNPSLFLVARENHLDNQELFQAVGAQIVMHPSSVIAERIRELLATPLLSEFENYARYRDHDWACELISRIAALVEDRVPEVWEVTIDADQAQAVCAATGQRSPVTLGTLLRDPRDREATLPAIALMLVHKSERTLLPEARVTLRHGDRVLFCGAELARSRMEWTLQNDHALDYVQSGESHHPGTLWAWGSRVLAGRSRRRH